MFSDAQPTPVKGSFASQRGRNHSVKTASLEDHTVNAFSDLPAFLRTGVARATTLGPPLTLSSLEQGEDTKMKKYDKKKRKNSRDKSRKIAKQI